MSRRRSARENLAGAVLSAWSVPADGLIDSAVGPESKENIDSTGRAAYLRRFDCYLVTAEVRELSWQSWAPRWIWPTAEREADHPHSLVVRFPAGNPLRLDAGIEFSPLQIAYQTYGTLNAERSNAVLVCHALTGDQHVVNDHPVTGKPGWWETMVGPGRPIDTERYFVICPNVVGGCMGSSGPASTNPATGMP